MDTDLLLGLILVIVTLLILVPLLKPASIDNSTNFPGLVEIANDPQISLSNKSLDEGVYEYSVGIVPHLQFKGDFARFGEQRSYIDVVPLLSFKGVEIKATSDGLAYFRIDESRSYSEPLEATVVSRKPPIEYIGSSLYSGEMKKGHIFLLEDKSQFLVELSSVESTVVEDVFCHRELGTGLCTATCWAYFNVKCAGAEIEKKSERLRGECDSDTSGCERTIECKEGAAYISVKKTDCGSDSADVQIEVSSAVSSGEKLGETMEISFWRKSECTEREDKYDSLRVKCNSDYLGGPYTLDYIPVFESKA